MSSKLNNPGELAQLFCATCSDEMSYDNSPELSMQLEQQEPFVPNC